MLVSYSWLKKYINLPDSTTAKEVAALLKASTVEVEQVLDRSDDLKNVVVGRVVSCEKHPNADKLKVCQVDVGDEKIQIVCGGSNVHENMLVAVALLGAKVRWHGEGELVEMVKASIRGVESLGMICASTEIGLGNMFPLKDEKEILDLTSVPSATVGSPLVEVLNLSEAVLEIDNKSLSNRPDLWGHYGVAREVAALTRHELSAYIAPEIKPGKDIKLTIKVEEPSLCPRYMAVAISGVKVEESPAWLKNVLVSVGLRPINNIVDITNYIMLDLGQPMHAFDANSIVDNTIIVRNSREGEDFITLDKQKHRLDTNALMITTADKALALAGVMGGLDSGINDNTQTIILESANFEPSGIRRTASKFGLRTDSSMRFEKSLDPNLCAVALQKAVEMVLQLCPSAKVASQVADQSGFKLFTGPLEIPLSLFAKKIGVDIPEKTIVDILSRLGFILKKKKDSLAITIPTWRATKDISLPEDIVEEVLRFFGYDNVESKNPAMVVAPPEVNRLRLLERRARQALVQKLNFCEVYNYSFVSASQVEKLGEEVEKYVELNNPIAKDRPYVRRQLLLNLLENVKQNIEYYPELRLLEIGKTFLMEESGVRIGLNDDELLPRQNSWFVAVISEKKNNQPFNNVLQALEVVMGELNTKFVLVTPTVLRPWEHPTRVASIIVGKQEVGRVYEIHPLVAENNGLESRVGVLAINLDDLLQFGIVEEPRYQPLPLFPEVVRDMAFTVKNEITHQSISDTIKAADPLIKKVELFDVYIGTHIGDGYKSMAYRITYGLPKRTLTTEEVDGAQKLVIKLLASKLGASAR